MHVASEEGNYSFKKSQALPLGRDSISLAADVAVCGLYVVAPPDKLVEITVKYMHVSCDSGGLLAVSVKYSLCHGGWQSSRGTTNIPFAKLSARISLSTAGN